MPPTEAGGTKGTFRRRHRRRPAVARPARVARMLALAIHVRRAVDDGLVADFAEVARQLGVSKQRISTLVRLTFLAPDLQHEILGLTTIKGEPVTERQVFEQVVRCVTWRDQRAAWQRLRQRSLLVATRAT